MSDRGNELSLKSDKTNIRRGDGGMRGGDSNISIAENFLEEFPIGKVLSAQEFDEWAQKRGYLNVPTGAPSQSDAWKSHLQRRHELKKRITRASTTQKMQTAFVIETVPKSSGKWIVRSPESAIAHTRVGKQVDSLIESKQRRLRYLRESADWKRLPVYEQLVAETLRDDIENYKCNVAQQGKQLEDKFIRLRRRLESLVRDGDLIPSNGGIKAITDDSSDEPDEPDGDEED